MNLRSKAPAGTRCGFLKTDPFARTSSLPPTGGRGVGTASSLTGRGGRWVGFSSAAEAVSQLPGPPLEDPPTSPPHAGRGRSWGERGGTCLCRAASYKAGAASRQACQLVWRDGCSAGGSTLPEARRLCGRRDTKRTAGARLARRSSRVDHFKDFSGPASGVAGDRGDDLSGGE